MFLALAVVVLLIVLLGGSPLWVRLTAEDALRAWAKERGLEILTLEIASFGAHAALREGDWLGDERW